MVHSCRASVRVIDLYFDESLPFPYRADIIRYNHFSQPVLGIKSTPSWTMLLDISQSPADMLSRMKDHTRYKIKRAGERDGLLYQHFDGADDSSISRFADHFDRCAATMG